MKQLLFLGLMMIFTVMSFAQDDAISKYFEKYMDDEDFSVVYISGKMFSMFADVDDDDDEAKEAMKGIKGLRILSTEKKGNALYNEAIKKFNVSEYEELMKIRDGKENVNFYIKEEGDVVKELLLIVGGEAADFVMLSFVGEINLKQISELSDSMDIDGLEHLDKVND
ncbi:MAG: hypothetical protein ACI94Y_000006 [Maribacter sp.]|jgi:hypothetical protein